MLAALALAYGILANPCMQVELLVFSANRILARFLQYRVMRGYCPFNRRYVKLEMEECAMRKLLMLGLALSFLIAVAVPASALTFWYGGDPNYVGSVLSESGGYAGNAMAYDDFKVTGKGWDVHTILGNFQMNFNASQAYYEVRSGVSEGNGGTLVSSGIFNVTQTYMCNYAGSNVYTVAGNVAAFDLAPGTYWLGLAPVGSSSNDIAWATETSGSGAYGKLIGDGQTYLNWSNGSYDFSSLRTVTGSNKVDLSYGVIANPAVVPEPSAMLAMGMGMLSFVPFLRRRK